MAEFTVASNNKYGIHKSTDDKSITYMDPLLVDYSLLISSSPKSIEELDKFKSALASWGCFQLINHGIPCSLLEEMKQVSRQFFALPVDEKLKYAMSPNSFGDSNGYGDNRVTNSSNHIIDWNEGLDLTVYPEDRRRLEFWPENPHNFKILLHEYTTKIVAIFDELFKKILQSLNVDHKKFANQYGKNEEVNVRFNFYPICPSSERVLGLKAHADFSAMTLLLQEEEGLQVLKDDKWFKVPVISDALFLNIGDPLEIMSNGIFKSAVHRVITSAEKSRLSIVMFWDSDRKSEIGPLDELITAARPQLYKRISLKDYVGEFLEYYQSGSRPIEAIKINN